MDFLTIIVERRGPAIWLRLNRPAVMNAFDPLMVEEIDHVLNLADTDDSVRALVLTGQGRAFCAGGDLAFVQRSASGKPHDERSKFLERLNQVLHRLEHLPVPVIAAVNGIALAGGLELILCCDLVVAAESAKIGDGHATYGFVPGGGASVRLPRKIGVNRANELFFTGEHRPAAWFKEAGLVNAVVPAERLAEAVEALVQSIAAKSPLTLRRMKRLVQDGLEQPVETAIRLEHMMGDLHWTSDDMKEGVAAFIEKRPPRYTGK